MQPVSVLNRLLDLYGCHTVEGLPQEHFSKHSSSYHGGGMLRYPPRPGCQFRTACHADPFQGCFSRGQSIRLCSVFLVLLFKYLRNSDGLLWEPFQTPPPPPPTAAANAAFHYMRGLPARRVRPSSEGGSRPILRFGLQGRFCLPPTCGQASGRESSALACLFCPVYAKTETLVLYEYDEILYEYDEIPRDEAPAKPPHNCNHAITQDNTGACFLLIRYHTLRTPPMTILSSTLTRNRLDKSGRLPSKGSCVAHLCAVTECTCGKLNGY